MTVQFMTMPASIRIREVGPREGFQTISHVVPYVKKLELIDALALTGVSAIEVTSFVKPDKVPQMADAEELVGQLKKRKGVHYTGLYLNEKGFVRAEETGVLDNEAWLNIAASETFLRNNNNTTIEDVISGIPRWIKLFSQYKRTLHGLMLSTAFGCNYEGEVDHSQVLKVLSRVVSAVGEEGVSLKEVCLADTMGWATPDKLKSLVGKVREAHSDLEVSLHLHDTRGTGIANVYAGLQEGVSCFDGSVGGMGGCPFANGAAGNVATEEIVYLCSELGIETGVDLDAYVDAAWLAEEIVGAPLPGKLYKYKAAARA